jgi:uncharacterized protein
MAAHLSALVAMIVAMAFVGPLVVYLVKKDDDPFVRDQAAEALSFQLSALLYLVVAGVLVVAGAVLGIGVLLLLVPLALVASVVWLVLIVIAAVRAGRGEAYRYPFTIRFVR